MMPTQFLNVKTGIMIDFEKVHEKDIQRCEDALMKLDNACEMGISGAAGFYLLFDYDNLDAAIKLLPEVVKKAEEIVQQYEERYESYLANPDIEDVSPCCDQEGVTWNADESEYMCTACHSTDITR